MSDAIRAEFWVDHGTVLEWLLVDSFAALLKVGVATLDRVVRTGFGCAAAGCGPFV